MIVFIIVCKSLIVNFMVVNCTNPAQHCLTSVIRLELVLQCGMVVDIKICSESEKELNQ